MHAPIERLGSTRNQYGDRLLRLVHVWSKLDLSNIIRLLELGFELQQFFYLLVNTWLYSWSKNSRTWHGRSREKCGTWKFGRYRIHVTGDRSQVPVIALVINNWYKLKLYWEGPEGFLGGISNFLEGGKGESGGLYFFLHLLKKEALFCGFFYKRRPS